MVSLRDRLSRRIRDLAMLFSQSRRILLMTHINPDGDALGSLLGCGLALEAQGKAVTMHCQGGGNPIYSFLPGVERVSADPGRPEDYDLAVLLDCHSLKRAGELALPMAAVTTLAVIDHHVVETELPVHALVDEGASAAAELVFYVLNEMGADITPEIAANLFVAISTDTGSFSYENTSPGALSVASELVRAGAAPWDAFQKLYMKKPLGRLQLLGLALKDMELHYGGKVGALSVTTDMMTVTGTTSADTDGFVEYPRSVEGVELAVFFREREKGGCKVSLRSRGRVNTAALASEFGGGGHRNAAGFFIAEPLVKARKMVMESAARYLPETTDGGRR